MSDADRIAGIVNERFQTLPTPAEQQRDRSGLIAELTNVYTQARNDWYASNRRIAHLEAELEAELAQLREKLAALAALEEYIGESCGNASHNIQAVLSGGYDPRPDAESHGLEWTA